MKIHKSITLERVLEANNRYQPSFILESAPRHASHKPSKTPKMISLDLYATCIPKGRF